MPCSRYVSICTIHENRTLLLLSASCGTSRIQYIWGFFCDRPHSLISWFIQMLTGQVVQTHASPPQSGYAMFLGDNLVSWSSKRQNSVSRSSAEAEYCAVANALLQELHSPPRRATSVYCDNISAVYMSSNPVQHQRTRHIEIDLYFVRERVSFGDLRVLHVPTSSQYADIFTKGLPSSVFLEFRSSLNVCSADDKTAGACYNVCIKAHWAWLCIWPLRPGSCGRGLHVPACA
ncbi:hypothetical protein U9M48_030698 [Paspalum notatum var. saurae]|uniref:Uncharacterized protein n=1 Tax=Paspalum notatum var. saurae TaxID=547442 RepID=A0AAQ3U169_PASNO